MNTFPFRIARGRGFSLIEVVVALGICSFSLVGIMGLSVIGLRDSRDSEDKIAAADLASIIFSARRASPLSSTGAFANLAIPAQAMTSTFAATSASDQYVTRDGLLTTDATQAAYRLRCMAGTNAVTGSNAAMVYLLLSFPPRMDPASPAAKTHEFVSCIPLR